MGSVFEIYIRSDHRRFAEAANHALDEVRRLENLMTVFTEDSEIAALNRWAFTRPVPVSPEIAEVLELGIDLSRQTGGAFDLTSGILSKIWGFQCRNPMVPPEDQLREALKRVGFDRIYLNQSDRTVAFTRPVELNLGSIGKGFALDRAARVLQNEGLGSVLMHAGFSSFKAIGDSGPSGEGWKVGIRHPVDRECEWLTLRLRNRSMATSGCEEQYFEIEGRRYGHILDPRSGKPADHHLSATALAPSAAVADALSTAFFVMSTEEVKQYCEDHPDVGAILAWRSEDGKEIRTVRCGIAEESENCIQ